MRLCVVLLVLAVAMLSACGRGAGSGGPETTLISPLWAHSYADVPSMASDSDLVVTAKVSKATVTQTANEYQQGAILIFTDWSLEVQTILKGSESGALVIRQTGGRTPTRVQEVADDPLFEIGATYALFLKKDQSSERYFVLGGPDGRLIVEQGTVMSLSQRYYGRAIGDLRVGSMPLDQLAGLVKD